MNTVSQPDKNIISKRVDRFFIDLYSVTRFALLFFKEAVTPPYEFQETIKQCFYIGFKSLGLITVTSFIIGMVFTDHSRPALADFGATSWLPSLTGAAIIKALAPLITSLICAGKIGSQIGAELGSMKVTEQIDAMEVSGINPFKFLVVTRIIATTFMVPVLMFYSAFIGLTGSFMDIHFADQASFTMFIHDVFIKIDWKEIISAVVRTVFFGFTIGLIGCYEGFNATKGTVGVGKAANSAVVIIMLLIFIEEMTIVKLFR
ncbi:ABC transporter permease [Niastella vici]|uniref:ABC transporter permease n=1 Tax=Niastella vici TaxID=1703345 RepID=A0A1V9FTP6_9BACT|nr:ABC transporter permease [Niastella vici]OQP61701.1 ABC transporter permease [Niastella vici]